MNTYFKTIRQTNVLGSAQLLPFALSCLLVWNLCTFEVWAQFGVPPDIRIVVLGGQGAVYNIRKPVPIALKVKVIDEKNQPISGAMVEFRSPDIGPSLRFASGDTRLVLETNAEGFAVVEGQRPNSNSQTGQYKIHVEARHGKRRATALIDQRNISEDGDGTPGWGWVLVLVGGVGAAVGGYLSIRRNGDGPKPPSTPPTTIGAGSVTVGPPP